MSRTRTKWLALGAAVAALTVGIAVPALAVDSPGAVQGQLSDGATPIEGAYVTLVDAEFNYVTSGQTDSTGAFALADVPPGDYKLNFDFPGGFRQWAVQRSSFDTADLITVTAGETTTVNETVRPHGSMTGQVYNSDGSPAAGATVSAAKSDPDYEHLYTTADADGRYTFPYLSAGEYRVSFQRDYSSPTQYANNTNSYDDAALIPVTVGAQTTLDQTLVALGALVGTVTKGGVPVEGVQIDAQEIGSAPGYGSATTGPDGTYRMPLWPGSYQVAFRLPNGLTQYAPRQLDPLKAGTYTVIADADTLLDEKIRRTGSVAGQLTDADGAPVPYASVTLTNKWNTQFVSTDDNGSYQVEMFPGTAYLQFSTDRGSQWSHGHATADTADQLSVVAGETLVVNEALARPGTIVVNAVDATTDDPVAEFCVDLPGGSQCTTTGAVTATGVLPGRHAVRFWPGEGQPYLNTGVTATVTSDATTEVTLPLVRGASVTTVITDANTGDPVPNACLELIDVTAPMWFGVNTGNCSDSTGVVTVPRLRPGSYKPFVWISDGVHGLQWVGPNGGVGKFKKATTVTVTAGQSFELPAVKLDKAGSITGTVTDEATGEPIRYAVVGLSTYNFGFGGGGGLVTTDAQGRYTQSGLGPYAWTLYISAWNYASEWSGDEAYRDRAAGVRVRAGKATTYDASLGVGTIVTGRVFGPDATRAADARITFINADSGDEIAAGDIYYSIRRYTVHVKGPQRVKLQYYATVGVQRYSGWVGGTDFTTATVYSVPSSGTKRLPVTVTETEP